MKNAIFIPSVPQSEWSRDVLLGISPAELPIAGRRYIDYALEAAVRFGVIMAEVLDWRWTERLQRDFADLTRTSIPIFYQKGEGKLPHGLRDLAGQSSPLTANMEDGYIVVWGLALPHTNSDDAALEPLTDEELAETPVGTYRLSQGRWMRVLPRGFVVKNVQTWFGLNMILLKNAYGFTLPGYSAESGVHIGSNVVLEKGTEAKPPVIVGDNAWCARNVDIDGKVIIGNGAVVAEGVRLHKTIICDDTFVGQGLDLSNKIVNGNRIIDGLTGVWTDVEEGGIARRITPPSLGWLGKVWRFFAGTSMGRRD